VITTADGTSPSQITLFTVATVRSGTSAWVSHTFVVVPDNDVVMVRFVEQFGSLDWCAV
jgi:hypothetical protein